MFVSLSKLFISQLINNKTSSSQSESTPNFKELKHLKQQITKLHSELIINGILRYVGVDTNIVSTSVALNAQAHLKYDGF